MLPKYYVKTPVCLKINFFFHFSMFYVASFVLFTIIEKMKGYSALPIHIVFATAPLWFWIFLFSPFYGRTLEPGHDETKKVFVFETEIKRRAETW